MDFKLEIKVLRKGSLIPLGKTPICLRLSIVRPSDASFAKEDKTDFVVCWPKKWGGKKWGRAHSGQAAGPDHQPGA